MGGVEFVCAHCRAFVFSAAARPPESGLCFRCSFLEETIPDPEERRAVLAYLDRNDAQDA